MQIERDYPFEETEIFHESPYPRLHFVEHEYSRDWTNWWVPNRACSEAMLRAAGFRIEAHPEEEVYLCRVAEVPYGTNGAGAVYPARAPA
jgi:tRNA (mo5U34)-methyltransferase